MKQVEKRNNKRTFYWTVAILCLIYGGVSLILSVQQAYFLHGREHIFSPSNFTRDIPRTISQNNFPHDNLTRNISSRQPVPAEERFRAPFMLTLFTSFFGSLVSILAGISLLNLLRKKETKEIKKDIIEAMILPDEKFVIHELEKSNGEITQSELVKRTKLSKVKVHRIIKRLESLEIVKKYPYGLTNKIKLEKHIWDKDI